ncbi:uncharacterized protein LOC132795836 [Drosophila nasuta]|uniref:uncharacterized protein LOC132795836 n=1 Tax=Drosophila nasuta TaxID=42062 RepID=UPI00295E9714|nr:uncharacterized protein LOC132795836 [Drosophila nasuta]
MSDTQRQVKFVAEQAMANLVEHAKRLQLSSVSTIPSTDENNFRKSLSLSNSTPPATGKKSKINVNASGIGVGVGASGGAQRMAHPTARKPRKIEAEPTPPPPSPRDQCMMAELRDEYDQTDLLIEKMLSDATSLNEDMIICSQHQRDLNLVQEIELETNRRSVDTLFEALSAECERPDLRDVMRRCCSALERSKERVCCPINSDLQTMNTASTMEDTTDNKTWPQIYYNGEENLENELPPPGYLTDLEPLETSVCPSKRQLDEILNHTTPTMDMDMSVVELITPQT